LRGNNRTPTTAGRITSWMGINWWSLGGHLEGALVDVLEGPVDCCMWMEWVIVETCGVESVERQSVENGASRRRRP
jgi:hypothetical protein